MGILRPSLSHERLDVNYLQRQPFEQPKGCGSTTPVIPDTIRASCQGPGPLTQPQRRH